MSRKNDRTHAFNLVFQLEFYDNLIPQIALSKYFQGLDNPQSIDRVFVEKEFFGVVNNKEFIDKCIGEASNGWELSRLSKVDLAIMRLSAFEILFSEDVPKKVSMNEAIELAKVFSSDEAPSFINGVLGKITTIGNL